MKHKYFRHCENCEETTSISHSVTFNNMVFCSTECLSEYYEGNIPEFEDDPVDEFVKYKEEVEL